MRIDWQTVKGILVGGGGITVSELQLWEGWISLAIKAVSLAVIIVTFLIYWNKYRTQVKENEIRLNEDESG